MTTLLNAARQALAFLDAEFGWPPGEAPRIDALRTAIEAAEQAEPAPMSQPNRLVAYSAAAKLRELGYEWDKENEVWKSEQAKPVAWCSLTPSGKIAHFDGQPMVMVGPVGNEHHTIPLYTTSKPRKPLTDEQVDALLERQQLSYEREREIDQDEIERLIALRRDDARALERMRALIAEADVLAEYGRDDGLRDWVNAGTWLYPGDRIVVLRHEE